MTADIEKKITVLIADDSTVSRRALRFIFETQSDFRVVGEATTGKEAVALAMHLKPVIVTMDLEMPDGNGLQATEEIMAYAPTRIMVVTGVPNFAGLDASFEALSRGALELISKDTTWPDIESAQNRIITLARRLAKIPVLCHPKAARKRRNAARRASALEKHAAKSAAKRSIVGIGASTGGPKVLRAILKELPANLPVPVVVAQHLSDVFASGFIEWLGSRIDLPVHEALPGTRIQAGNVYIAVRGAHVVVTHSGWIAASHEAPRNGHCPSIDVLFESIAQAYGAGGTGILLTGMGNDGASGLHAVLKSGGVTVAQDEASSTVFGMPQVAIKLGAAEQVLPYPEIAQFIINATIGKKARHT